MISFRVTPSFTALCSRSRKNGAENILAIEHAELNKPVSRSRTERADCVTRCNSTRALIRWVRPGRVIRVHVPPLFTPLHTAPSRHPGGVAILAPERGARHSSVGENTGTPGGGTITPESEVRP